MEHLTPLDDVFVVLERDDLPMHIGGLLIFQGGAPSYQEFLQYLDARLDQIPRYRQIISRTPLNLGPPAWLDDPHFHLPYHVRHTALPAPGTEEQLLTLTSRILSLRIDLDRPPWELWLIEVLLDARPDPPQEGPSRWTAKPSPSYPARIAASLEAGVRQPVRRLRQIGAYAEIPREAIKSIATTALGLPAANSCGGRTSMTVTPGWSTASVNDAASTMPCTAAQGTDRRPPPLTWRMRVSRRCWTSSAASCPGRRQGYPSLPEEVRTPGKRSTPREQVRSRGVDRCVSRQSSSKTSRASSAAFSAGSAVPSRTSSASSGTS